MSAPSPSFTFGDQSKDAAAAAGSTAAAPQAHASAPPLLTGEDYARHKMDPSNIILRAPSEEEEEALEEEKDRVPPRLCDLVELIKNRDVEVLFYCWRASVRGASDIDTAVLDFFVTMNARLDSPKGKKELSNDDLLAWGRAFVKAHFMPRPKLPTTLPNGVDIGCPFLYDGDTDSLISIAKNVEGASNSALDIVCQNTFDRSTFVKLLFFGGDSGSGKTHAALFLPSYLRRRGVNLGRLPPVVVYAVVQSFLNDEDLKVVSAKDAIMRDESLEQDQRYSARKTRNRHAVDLLSRVIRQPLADHINRWHEYYSPDNLPSCFLVLDELMACPALLHALMSQVAADNESTSVLYALNRSFRDTFRDVRVVGASTVSSATVEFACSLVLEVHAYQLLPSSVLFEKQMTELKPLYKCLSTNAPYMYVMHNYRCATEALKTILYEEKRFYQVLSDALGALQPWRALHKSLRKWCNMGSTSPNPTQISSARTKLAALCDNLEGALEKINADGMSRMDNVGEEEQSTYTTIPKGTLQLGEESKNSGRADPQKTLAMLKQLSSNFRQGLTLLNPEGTTSNSKTKKSKKADKSKNTASGNKRSNSDKPGTASNNINNSSYMKRSKDTSATSISYNNSLFDKDALKTWLDSQCSLDQSVDRIKETVFSHAADIASHVIKLYMESNGLTQYGPVSIHRIVERGAVLCLNGNQTWQKGIGSSNNNTGANAASNDTASEHNKANADSALPDPVRAGLVSVNSTTEQDMLTEYTTVTTTYRMGMHQLILGMTATAGSNAASEGNRIATPPTIRELCSFHPRRLVKFWLHLFAFLSEALRRHAAGGDAARMFTTVVEQFLYNKKTHPLTKAQTKVLALMDADMTDATTLLKASVAFPGNWRSLQSVDDWAKEDRRSQITESFCRGVDRDPAKRKGLFLILNGDSATYADTAIIGRGTFALVSVKRRADYGGNRKELLHDVATLGFRVSELEEEHQKCLFEPQIDATAQLKAHLQCSVAVPVFVLFHEPHYNILKNMPEVEVRATEEGGTPALRIKPIVLYIRPYLEYTEKTNTHSVSSSTSTLQSDVSWSSKFIKLLLSVFKRGGEH